MAASHALASRQPHDEMVTQANYTTAKSQAMAVCCAAIERCCNCGTGGQCCPPSMVAWARSASTIRAWADEWVLWPSHDAVFRLPVESNETGVEFIQHYLYVSVSPTLGVVSQCCFSWPHYDVVGCVGDGKLLLALRNMADEKDSYCIMGVPPEPPLESCSVPAVFTVHYGWVRCNRHWILCEKHGMIHVWKVVDGAVVEPGLCFSDLEGKTVDVIEFSPLCDDTVIVTFGVGSIPASIFCIDLAASFRSRELVIVSKFPCRAKKFPLGVLQMPDGSMATVNSHKSKPFYLVECTTGDSHEFREGTGDVTPIGKCHALVVSQEMDDQKFEVYHTSDLATPTFCVPGTWACPHGGSGLIVSTTHRLLKDNHCNEAPFLVHDGVTGFKIGDFYLNSHFYVPNHTVWCMSL